MRSARGAGGFTLVEVMVAIAVFAIATLTLTPLAVKLTETSSDVSRRTAATGLVARQIEAVQKLDLSANQSALPLGLSTSTVTVGGTVYTIQQNTTLSDRSTSTSICRATGATSLAYKLVTVKVTWPGMSASTAPVRADTLKALGVGTDEAISGGTVAISVTGIDGAQGNIPVTLAGNGTTTTQLTGDDGCVVFSGLTGSLYTATADSPGFVGIGNRQNTGVTVTGVTSASISRATLTYAYARTLPFTFTMSAGSVLATGLAVHVGGSYVADAVPASCAVSPTVLCTDAVPGTVRELYPDTFTLRAGNCVETGSSSSASVQLTTRTVPDPPVAVALGTITVTVKTLLGVPVAGRNVTLTHAVGTGCPSGDTLTGTTDATGKAVLALPYGTWAPSTTSVGAAVGTILALTGQSVSTSRSPSVNLVVLA